MPSKSFMSSKTMWANSILLVASIVGEVLKAIPEGAGVAVIIVTTINIILRYISFQPIHFINPNA